MAPPRVLNFGSFMDARGSYIDTSFLNGATADADLGSFMDDRGPYGDASFLNGTTANSELRILHGWSWIIYRCFICEWSHSGF